jgi:hypothetical protein
LPPIALMFVVEHRVRGRRLPNDADSRIVDGVLAYWRDLRARVR